jgi:hypothetical protein
MLSASVHLRRELAALGKGELPFALELRRLADLGRQGAMQGGGGERGGSEHTEADNRGSDKNTELHQSLSVGRWTARLRQAERFHRRRDSASGSHPELFCGVQLWTGAEEAVDQ